MERLKKYKKKILIYFSLVCLLFVSPLCSLIFSMYLLFNKKSGVNQYYSALIFSISIAYFAFHVVPLETDDLFRHYKILNTISKTSLLESLNYGYPGVPLNTFIMGICSIIMKDPRFYPFILIFVGFYFVCILFIKCQNKFNISLNLQFLIFMFIFFEMVPRYYFSGLRNHFIFIIQSFFIINYYFKSKKKKPLFLFIFISTLMYFIHNGAILFLVIVLFYEFIYSKITNFKLKRIFDFLIVFCLPIVKMLISVVELFIPSLMDSTLFQKIAGYTSQFFNIHNLNQYLLFLVLIGFNMIITYLTYKKSDILESQILMYLDFFRVVCIFAISYIPNMMLLLRFIYLITFLSIPVLYVFFNSISNDKYKVIFSCVMVLILSVQIIYTYRSLCAYPLVFDIDIKNLLLFML